jgi:hypothetical protein
MVGGYPAVTQPHFDQKLTRSGPASPVISKDTVTGWGVAIARRFLMSVFAVSPAPSPVAPPSIGPDYSFIEKFHLGWMVEGFWALILLAVGVNSVADPPIDDRLGCSSGRPGCLWCSGIGSGNLVVDRFYESDARGAATPYLDRPNSAPDCGGIHCGFEELYLSRIWQ